VRKEYGIVVMFEHYFESERVVYGTIPVAIGGLPAVAACSSGGCLRGVLEVPSFSSTLVVRNVKAITAPPHAILGCLLDRVNKRLHSLVVIRIGLHEVDDIKAVHLVFARVFDLKEVPLSEAVSTVVVLQIQVIFAVTDLYSFAQVSTFEATLEDQRVILGFWLLELVKWSQAIIVAIEAGALRSVRIFRCAEGRLLPVRHLTRTVSRGLLKAIWKVHRVEVVAFLVRLLNLALAANVWRLQLDQVFFIDKHVAGGRV